MRRLMAAFAAATAAIALTAGPALACGGLIGPNGAVNLLRTTTFAGYHDGVEHYVTSFEFAGGGGAFGSITPLPGVPSSVERGGDWTLQRLIRETETFAAGAPASSSPASATRDAAEVLLEKRIDALDITVLRGGGDEVGLWAKQQGFRLPADAPEVLDFYAQRSPIFLAARFDAAEAAKRGQQLGDGTPIHVTIPTANPWVPLRILGLGKSATETVEADVYLLTDSKPALLPAPLIDDIFARLPFSSQPGLFLDHNAPASAELLADLRSDKGMGWVPTSAWLTKVRIDTSAQDLTYDLAVDASGKRAPSRVAAGLEQVSARLPADAPTRPGAETGARPQAPIPADDRSVPALLGLAAVLVVTGLAVALLPGRAWNRRRSPR